MISFRTKLIILISVLVAVSQLSTGFIISRQSEEALCEQHDRIARTMARNISQLSTQAFLSRDLASLYEQVKLAMQEANVLFVKIVDLENTVIMSETLSEVGEKLSFSMDTAAAPPVPGRLVLDASLPKTVEPVMLGDEVLGNVILGYSHVEIRAAISELKKKIITTLLIGLTGAILMAALITGMITAPLMKLEATAAKIASGKFDLVRPDEKRDDEFSLLSRTMYNMAKRLESLVYNDPLTGVYNRLLLNTRLREELARSTRYAWPLAMLMVDIDHFKKINDSHGHLAGDEMLLACTRIFSEHIREEDCLARFGGEEFVILAPNMTAENALLLAERIRSAIENEDFVSSQDSGVIRMTISVGIAVYPDHAQTENELLGVADRALYRAKTEGRNRVVLFSEQVSAQVV